MTNPYGHVLGDRDPFTALGETPQRIRALIERWPDSRFDESYAPGKWSGREILLHLAHTEMAFGSRARLALSTKNYVVQPFDQDTWMKAEPPVDGPDAFDAYCALRKLNLAFFRHLTPEQRATTFSHPERGTITLNWIIALLAGHDIHHLWQLEKVGQEQV